jgi:hypothetical protein
MLRACNKSPQRKTSGDDAVTQQEVTFSLLEAAGI